MPARKIDSTRPNIFVYHDHLSFLRDWLDFLKQTERGFSMRQLAKDSQLAIGYLSMCLSNKRTLSTKAVHKILPQLRLNAQERRFFELLHIVGTSEEPSIRLQALADMSRSQNFRVNNSKEVAVYQYLTKWFYVAIREMVTLTDFKPDPNWIQERLGGGVSLAECKEALRFLLDNGFIEVADSRYTLPVRNLDCKEGVFKASLGEFHRQMFRLASQSIDGVARAHRRILGHTFSIRTEDLGKVHEILEEAQAKLERLSEKTTNADHVYHVEFASFPLTKRVDDSEGEPS